jgi:hypothetical protein
VTISNPKQHKGAKASRLVTAYYYVPTLSGERFQVCQNLFLEATGKTETAIRHLRNRLLKNELLANGNLPGETKVNRKRADKSKLEESIVARKEKILSLKKGSFSLVQNQSGVNEPEVVINESGFKQSRTRQIDLNDLDCCRLCLQNKKGLLSIFRKGAKTGHSPADLIQSCLPIKLNRNDGMPQKICSDCFGQVQVANQLKLNSMESMRIMMGMMMENEGYQIPENRDALEDYIESDEKIDEDLEMEDTVEIFKEEILEQEELEIKEEPDEPINPPESPDDPPNPEKTRKIFSGPSIIPRKCYLCNEKFRDTPEEHFSACHQLVENSNCSKCSFETEFPWILNLHYQVHQDDYKIW